METPSNARPIAILAGYMVLAGTLAIACIRIVRRGIARHSDNTIPSTRRFFAFLAFTLLAVVSLATTWYHMFCFFEWSYTAWKARRLLRPGNSTKLYLGQWLRETSLFKQAWASTFETPARAWWSLQIFGFCANWSVMLAVQAKKRKIPHLWAFMLLGQVVAISFASNLFFLAVLAHDVVAPAAPLEAEKPKEKLSDAEESEVEHDDDDDEAPKKPKSRKAKLALTPAMAPFWYHTVLGLTVGCAVSVPDKFGTSAFMRILLAPHILAFVPLLINKVLRREVPAPLLNQPIWYLRIANLAALLATGTMKVWGEGGDFELILSTLHEHPAVSSVGWDVICCWVSYGAWHLLGEE
ncbi:hypothetical protein ACHAQA_006956 [Verticillium albo-atrum]